MTQINLYSRPDIAEDGGVYCPFCGAEISDMDDGRPALVTRMGALEDVIVGCTSCLDMWGSETWKEYHGGENNVQSE